MIIVYVLKGESGKRYVGITNHLERRIWEHRSGRTKAGQILVAFTIFHTEEHPDYSGARAREKFLKSGRGRTWLDEFERETRPAQGG